MIALNYYIWHMSAIAMSRQRVSYSACPWRASTGRRLALFLPLSAPFPLLLPPLPHPILPPLLCFRESRSLHSQLSILRRPVLHNTAQAVQRRTIRTTHHIVLTSAWAISSDFSFNNFPLKTSSLDLQPWLQNQRDRLEWISWIAALVLMLIRISSSTLRIQSCNATNPKGRDCKDS